MERQRFFSKARRWLTGELTPDQRQEILTYLNQRQEFVKRFLAVSSFYNLPLDKPVPRDLSMRDVRVLIGEMPFEAATDRTLRAVYKGTRMVERNSSTQA